MLRVTSPLQMIATLIYFAGAMLFIASRLIKKNTGYEDVIYQAEMMAKAFAIVATTVTGIYIIC